MQSSMAVGGDSEGESSPGSPSIRLAGPRYRAHQARPRAADPRAPGRVRVRAREVVDVDDDDDDDDGDQAAVSRYTSSSSELVDGDGQQWGCAAARPKKRVRRAGYLTGTDAAGWQQELNVAELQTSGYGNNCLWFSTQLAMGKFTVQDQYSTEQQEASCRGRTLIHSELQRAASEAVPAYSSVNTLTTTSVSESSMRADLNSY